MSLRINLFSTLRSSVALGLAVASASAADSGDILIGELNCLACHDASSAAKIRLASRQAPRLGQSRITPQWLRTFLAAPSEKKPGTFMPDLLHGLTTAEKSAAADALTHYLISLQPLEQGMPAGASSATIAAGEHLYHSVGCAACHAPSELPVGLGNRPGADAELEQIKQSSVPIGPLASKTTVFELAAFLKDPLATRPSGRMPSLKLDDGEARAIAMYLLREQAVTPATGPPVEISGLTFEYYEQGFPELPQFDRLKPTTTGSAETFTLAVARRKNDFALRFHGVIAVPKEGDYKFYVESDDGARLSIDEKLLVDNGGIHPKQERGETIKLTPGQHAISLVYFDAGADAELKVRWKGPGIDKQEIPASVLSHEGMAMKPLGDVPFTVDTIRAEHGRQLFLQLNCAACHQLETVGVKAKPIAELDPKRVDGCLGNAPARNVPDFHLAENQRQAIAEALTKIAEPRDARAQLDRTLTALNCYACHQRDGRGQLAGLRREYFTAAGDVDLGDEGRIPPHLDAAGAKLKPQWMEKVLTSGTAVRPYMATRMPQFGRDNVQHLPAAFEQVDGSSELRIVTDATAAKFGRKLVGVGGLTCVACHTFAGHPSLGVPAIDLATTGARLKPEWFRRYLLDPQTLRPGTRMPGFWPNGHAANTEILGGDTEKQIAAIWGYLEKGKEADLPAGLVQGKQEIVAANEAVIYRNFIDGGGARAIGVGYPEKANLAFDANEMRIAMIWQGAFIDAARHRSGRGAGYEKPLGINVQKGTPGAPFAVLASESAPWPNGVGRAAGYQFRGYRLDEKQRPIFRYVFNDVQVEDYPVAVPGEVDGNFRRTLVFTAKQPIEKLFFRAACAAKLEPSGAAFVVDGKVQLKFPEAQPIVRQSDGKTELLVPIIFDGNVAKLVEEISW